MCLQEEYDRADLPHTWRGGKVPLSPRLAAGLTQGVRGGLPLVRGRRGGSGGGSGLQIQVSVSDTEKMKSVDMRVVCQVWGWSEMVSGLTAKQLRVRDHTGQQRSVQQMQQSGNTGLSLVNTDHVT